MVAVADGVASDVVADCSVGKLLGAKDDGSVAKEVGTGLILFLEAQLVSK